MTTFEVFVRPDPPGVGNYPYIRFAVKAENAIDAAMLVARDLDDWTTVLFRVIGVNPL